MYISAFDVLDGRLETEPQRWFTSIHGTIMPTTQSPQPVMSPVLPFQQHVSGEIALQWVAALTPRQAETAMVPRVCCWHFASTTTVSQHDRKSQYDASV